MKNENYWKFLTGSEFSLGEKGYESFSEKLELDTTCHEKKEELVKNTKMNIVIEEDLVSEFRKKYNK